MRARLPHSACNIDAGRDGRAVEGCHTAHPWDVAGYATLRRRRVWLELFQSRLFICDAPDAKTECIVALSRALVERKGGRGVDICGRMAVEYDGPGLTRGKRRGLLRCCTAPQGDTRLTQSDTVLPLEFVTAHTADMWVQYLQLFGAEVAYADTAGTGGEGAICVSANSPAMEILKHARGGGAGGDAARARAAMCVPPALKLRGMSVGSDHTTSVSVTPLGALAIGRPCLCVDDLDVLEPVGHGRFASVARVHHRRTGADFALKKTREHVAAATENERAILSDLSHPYVVGLVASFWQDGALCLLMPFLSGGELFSHIQHEGALDEPRARFYAAEIALALQYLHDRGVVHRDIKPENCVLDADGHVVVTDFGLAVRINTNPNANARAEPLCGTPAYVAPELLHGAACTTAVDWWAFACVVYHMLAGAPLFSSECGGSGSSEGRVYDAILAEDLPLFAERVSPVAERLLRALLVKDPALRRRRCAPATLRCHAFFAGIDWERVAARDAPAPSHRPPPRPMPADDPTLFDDFSGRFGSPASVWGHAMRSPDMAMQCSVLASPKAPAMHI